MGSVDGIFMNIAAVAGLQDKCFEEVRVDDYLKAYTTTGRPPLPVPQTPTGDNERTALGLPLLFKPVSMGSEPTIPPKPKILNPADLPVGQEFKETVAEERYQTISCMAEYEGFAHEELRYYAYLRGNVMSPIPITMHPFAQPPPSTANTTPSNVKSGETAEAGKETLENISAQTPYLEHSPEELRISFLLSGRELNSAEIKQSQNPTTAAPPPQTAPTTVGFGLALGSPINLTPVVPTFKF